MVSSNHLSHRENHYAFRTFSGDDENRPSESIDDHQQTEQTFGSVDGQDLVHPLQQQQQRQSALMSTHSVIAAATAAVLADDESNEEEDTSFSSPVDLTIKK